MCPDKELISAYYDGETDARWSSEIKAHVDDCPQCSEKYEQIKRLSIYLNNTVVPNEEIIKARVYEAIKRKKSVIYPEKFWKKHVELSFPALLGAAVIVVILCAAMLIGLQPFKTDPIVVEEIPPETNTLHVQLISIEDAAAYLLSDDSGFDVLITIPAAEGLSVTGEPQLIREADYKRGQ